jgi:K+/H+ antiporter YhaU regulatory subunit KhtT
MAGFGNDAIAVMIMLLVISHVIWRTGFVPRLFESWLKPSSGYRHFLVQMMPFVGGSSAFMNNTPVVAMMIPFVTDWGNTNKIPVSKLLMLLSWAAILGGMVTLIGTSTNLIVNSLVVGSGELSLSILDFTPVGLILFAGGMAYVLFIGYRTLPVRKSPSERLAESPREYITNLVLDRGSDLAGKTVEAASFRSLKDLFLVEILRGDRVIAPVSPQEVLVTGDQLVLAGKISAVAELAAGRKGLSLAGEEAFPKAEKLNVVKVVVSPRSSLNGVKVVNSNFRGRYDAAILAVHRQGRRQVGKTWLAMSIAEEHFKRPCYLNYDNIPDARVIRQQSWPLNSDLTIFDEIHKMPEWKRFLKGVVDTKSPETAILVTGSSGMDTFRQTGDSLAGRHYHYRLWPFSVAELVSSYSADKAFSLLQKFGGFPKPLLAGDEIAAQRWRFQYFAGIVREDILEFSRLQEVRSMRLLVEILRGRVGSPLS